ncbi:unnamed protein product [Closterium sp. Yama58-4]|nr:unnamed protein product [Closterium sp. Yama58-4]
MAVVAREVVRFIETCIPADVAGTQLLLSQTEKAVADSFQDSLTAESYLGAMPPPATLPLNQGRQGGGREGSSLYSRQSAFDAQGSAWSGQGEESSQGRGEGLGEEKEGQWEGQGEGREGRGEGQGEGVAVVEDEERETFSYLDDERFNECTQLLKRCLPPFLFPLRPQPLHPPPPLSLSQLLARDYVAAGLCSIQLFLYSPDLRTAATHLQQAQLLFEKGTEARQHAAADLAASIGPLAAAGKRLAVSAASSSSSAAAGTSAAGGTGVGSAAAGGAGISGAGTTPSSTTTSTSSTAASAAASAAASLALIGKQRAATAKISDEDLLRLQRLAELQVEVVRVVGAGSGRDSSGVPLVGAARKAPWSVALFGAPSDGRTNKRRVEVTEFLVEREFDLALEVINFLHLPAVQIYASVAASLAEKQQHRVLFEGLMDRIKYMLPPADMDEVIGAAVMVYTHTAVKLSTLSLTFTGRQDMSRSVKLPKEQIDRLIHMLSDEHKKVLFNVACRRLRLAFQIATGHFQSQLIGAATPAAASASSTNTGGGSSSSGGGGFGSVYPLQSRINDVIFIMHEARNAPKVRELCREWLAARGVVIENVERSAQANLLPHTHAWPLGHGVQQPQALQ